MTRKRSASAASVGRNEPLVPPRPCTASTGAPCPASMIEIVVPPGRDRPEPQAPPLGGATRRRQEPDAQMQVTAHRQPPRLEGRHPAAEIFRDGRPRPAIGGEHRVGRAGRPLEPRDPIRQHCVDRRRLRRPPAGCGPCLARARRPPDRSDRRARGAHASWQRLERVDIGVGAWRHAGDAPAVEPAHDERWDRGSLNHDTASVPFRQGAVIRWSCDSAGRSFRDSHGREQRADNPPGDCRKLRMTRASRRATIDPWPNKSAGTFAPQRRGHGRSMSKPRA